MTPMSRCIVGLLLMQALSTAAAPRRGGSEVSFHPGMKFQPVNSYLLRGYETLNYVLTVPNIEVGRVDTVIPNLCHNKTTHESDRKLSLPCNFMNHSDVLLMELTKSVRSLLESVNFRERTSNRKTRGFMDFIWRDFFGVASDSDMRQVVSSEKDMTERLRLLRFTLEMQNADENAIIGNLNDWSANLTQVYEDLFSHADGMHHLLEQSESIDRALLSSTLKLSVTSLSEMLTMTHFLRERMILSDCEQGKLPLQALNISDLQEKLRNISSRIKSEGLILSIDPEDIWSYTNVKVVTCKRSKSTLHITLRIPVMLDSDQQAKVYHVQPLYFVFNGEQCKLAGGESVIV